ncbi:MAG: segregation/condensation protein A [Eubacteriales bacterium]|nr:segregation/condensation protein A [Eubacteriales bacterium]MDD4105620.1 segregation/condensation protein A [Eubacteriales bacterium]MDD4711107.1 segregation/condensation protein A [Eubacteriales bacterium]NLO14811.1 segregation/condensation protein A [Clostridiales bacterium]
MAIMLHLDQFDGPLDLLLFLVGKAKIDIRDIFVSEITNQYIQYVSAAQDVDMDEASAFVQMAATLLEIKSRSLLPKADPPQEDDPELVLIRQLEEYALLKEITQEMQGFEQAAAKMYAKLPEEYPLPPPALEITGLTLDGLVAAFARALARVPREDEPQDPRQHIMRDEFTVAICIGSIMRKVKGGRTSFQSLFSTNPTRTEVVTLFLALLELLRLGRISCFQDNTYEDIILTPMKKRA